MKLIKLSEEINKLCISEDKENLQLAKNLVNVLGEFERNYIYKKINRNFDDLPVPTVKQLYKLAETDEHVLLVEDILLSYIEYFMPTNNIEISIKINLKKKENANSIKP